MAGKQNRFFSAYTYTHACLYIHNTLRQVYIFRQQHYWDRALILSWWCARCNRQFGSSWKHFLLGVSSSLRSLCCTAPAGRLVPLLPCVPFIASQSSAASRICCLITSSCPFHWRLHQPESGLAHLNKTVKENVTVFFLSTNGFREPSVANGNVKRTCFTSAVLLM